MENQKKQSGRINLTWPKLIIMAILAGIITAVIALIPALQDTSFSAITVTFEVWILFGIFIIMNSKSNLDSALKCFVFFLISQPLVYLIQVPFSSLGLGIFGYYRYWFIWTILCFPMGFVGYWMKKGKWWGYLILLPMIALTGYSYFNYFSNFLFSMPRYILISIFCACAMILYPVAIFADKRIKITGAIIGGVAVVIITVICLLKPPVYNTNIMYSGDEYTFDDTYSVSLSDDRYGDIKIRYDDGLEDYVIYADFKKSGDTVMTLTAPTGDKKEFNIHIERSNYEVTDKN